MIVKKNISVTKDELVVSIDSNWNLYLFQIIETLTKARSTIAASKSWKNVSIRLIHFQD